MSDTSFDDNTRYLSSDHHQTNTSIDNPESINSASERTPLLENRTGYESASAHDEEATQTQEADSQPLLTEQPTKSVFAIIGLLLLGERTC